jgi:hypothetical protein
MTFADLQFESKDKWGLEGEIASASFPNGYGVSVITGPGAYGGEVGLYELAVTHPNGDEGRGALCYSTPITDDVIGYLYPDDVTRLMTEISMLPETLYCNHDRYMVEEEDGDDDNVQF